MTTNARTVSSQVFRFHERYAPKKQRTTTRKLAVVRCNAPKFQSIAYPCPVDFVIKTNEGSRSNGSIVVDSHRLTEMNAMMERMAESFRLPERRRALRQLFDCVAPRAIVA